MNKRISTYEKWVFVAYGYFLLIALLSLVFSIAAGSINLWALGFTIIMGAQAYFRKRLTNLIIGIITFGLSVFWLLEFMLIGKKYGFNSSAILMIVLTLISLVLSGILIFSFTKLGFKDE